MATAALDRLTPTEKVEVLTRQKQSLRSSLANLKESAQVAASRGTTLIVAGLAGYGTGRLMGWAKKGGTNPDGTQVRTVYLPNTRVPIPLLVGGAIGAIGAIFPKQIGESAADLMLGFGGGTVAGSAAVMGYEDGIAPDPAPGG